jgi:hypothetical protein
METTIESLKYLTEISDQDRQVLQAATKHTQQWADEFGQMVYETLLNYQPTREVFKEGEPLKHKKMMETWYLQAISGEFDDQFWRHQWRVGLRHVERGILNVYMLGLMDRVQRFFLDKCMSTFDPEHGTELFKAFQRVTDVASALIAEGYHSPYAVLRVRR